MRLEWGVSGQLLRAVQTGLSGCAAPAHTRPVAPRARLRQGARSKAPAQDGGRRHPFGQRRAEQKTRNPTGGWQPQTVAPQAQR